MFKKLLSVTLGISMIFLSGCAGTKQIDKASLAETVIVSEENGQIYYTFYLLSGDETPYSISVPSSSFKEACKLAREKYIPELTLTKFELYVLNENLQSALLKKDVKFMSEQWYFSPNIYVTLCDNNTAEIFSYDKSAPEIVETHLIHLKNKVSNVSINSLSIFNNFSDNKTKELSVSYINSEKEIKAEILKLSTEK
ncbi:MAG: hypothetical protein U0L76_01395 [Ruminococcus sp.]|nr:hypothetical protein [Ruminococcus sp.]